VAADSCFAIEVTRLAVTVEDYVDSAIFERNSKIMEGTTKKTAQPTAGVIAEIQAGPWQAQFIACFLLVWVISCLC
jgi:hypothetical protein